jgi:hypothetical protein
MERAAAGRSRWKAAIRTMLLSLVVNALCPAVLFTLLSGRGVATIPALLLTASFPLAATLVTWLRARRTDGVGVLSLLVIALGIVVTLVSDDPHLYLVKESFLTGGFAVACLGSLLLPRPLLYPVWGHYATLGDPAAVERWRHRWSDPGFRRIMRLFTLAWGLAFGADALLRVPLAFYGPPSLVLLVNPIVTIAIVIGLAAWMIRRWRAFDAPAQGTRHA